MSSRGDLSSVLPLRTCALGAVVLVLVLASAVPAFAATPKCGGLPVTIKRDKTGDLIGKGKDNIVGTAGDDVINGMGGNDIVNGGGGADLICGGGGDDKLFGGGAYDQLIGGTGDDTMSAGADGGDTDGGSDPAGGVGDTVTFANAPSNLGGWDVDADLDIGVATSSWGTENIANVENIRGSNGDDKLYGDGQSNAIYGVDGDDIVAGWSANDYLEAGEGNDLLAGGPGADLLDGGPNREVTPSPTNAGDIVYYDLSTGFVSVQLGSSGSLSCSPGCASDGFGPAGTFDDLVRIESVVGPANQISAIEGNDADNYLQGGSAADVINGNGGDDFIQSAGGNDFIDGGSGIDPAHGGAGADECRSALNNVECETVITPDS